MQSDTQRTAEKGMDVASRGAEAAAHTAAAAVQTVGDTVAAVMDRLTNKHSELRLSFEDLTFDMGVGKARLNGAIVLQAEHKDQGTT